jgi:hypothetical protein
MIEWSTTRSTGTRGSIGFLPNARHAAHGRQIGQQGHARKVLQHHAGHHERDFVGARGLGLPVAPPGPRDRRVTFLPSQLRNTDSSTMRMDTGKRAMPG